MMLIASVNTVEILLILAAVGHGEETEKPVCMFWFRFGGFFKFCRGTKVN